MKKTEDNLAIDLHTTKSVIHSCDQSIEERAIHLS